MPHRRVTIKVPAEMCNPGVFDADFTVTIEGLTAKIELQAMTKAKGDMLSMAYWFAYFGIAEVDGVPLNEAEGEREWFWEALGPARQMILGAYAAGCMGGQEAGKAVAEMTVD